MIVTLMSSLLGCPMDEPTVADPPGPLQVGVARVRMPLPIGIGTAGYGGFVGDGNPTPFSEIYPGTERLHNHPDFRVVVVSRGPGHEVVFLRSDMLGVVQQFRRALVLELSDRLGRDLDDALIIGATHTHSGPGRVIDGGGPFDLITDRFFPEFYVGLVDAMADVVEAAFDDLAPGRLGTAIAETSVGHDDRRCEDGLIYDNGALPIVALEQEGELVGLMLGYAIHGTVLGLEELTLSQDVSGGIEQAVADRFDHRVQVQLMNTWGADMSPTDPVVPVQPGSPMPDGYSRMEAVGQAMADVVAAKIDDLSWTDTPDIVSRTTRVPIDTEILGYSLGEFPYPFGGVYCGLGIEQDCDATTTFDGLDQICVPFNEEYAAPDQTEFTAGQLGPLSFVTFPGEPGTLLAEQIMADMQAQGSGDVLFLGYSQDYLGYSILEEDWWQGGYEASGALWGPRQGAYLAEQAVVAWAVATGRRPALPGPSPVEPFVTDGFVPYTPTPGTDVGTIVTEVSPSYGPTDEVTFVVSGRDPWLGTPLVVLQHADGSPVLRPNGVPVDSDGQAFWISLQTDPTYVDALEAPARTFLWQVTLPVTHEVIGAAPPLAGSYRLAMGIPDGAGGETQVLSATFEVAATR